MKIFINEEWINFNEKELIIIKKSKQTLFYYQQKYINFKTKVKSNCSLCKKEIIYNLKLYPKINCNHCNKKINCFKKYGVYSYSQIESVKEKISNTVKSKKCQEKTKQTCLKKYGVLSTNSLDTVKEKKKQTTKNNFGVEYPQQSKEIREKTKISNNTNHGGTGMQSKTIKQKIINTNKKLYGVEYPQQSKEIREKTKNNMLIKYGVDNSSKIPEIKIKREKCCLQKYGVNYPFQSKEIQIKCTKTLIEKYGVCNSYLIKMIKHTSKTQILFYKQIKNIFFDAISEYKIPNIGLVADIYIPSTNTIIEFYGDFWHCNPSIYDEKFKHPLYKKCAKEIWQYDKKRENKLINAGYKVIIVWEKEKNIFINKFKK